MDQPVSGQIMKFDKTNAVIAAITTAIAFIIYYMTVAPTLSYWDCGEFIACAHILGNPHPPGSPMFVLVGRLFDMFWPSSDPAHRINMLSVVSSSIAALFAYLILVRMVTAWYVGKSSFKTGRIIAYVAGFTGGLFMAFGQTNWNNSVEAEVYGLAMIIFLAIFWLSLKWFDHRYRPAGQQIIILASFLAVLGIGVHMTVFLVVPIVAIFFCLKRNTTRTDWGIVAGFFIFELLLIIILSGLNLGNMTLPGSAEPHMSGYVLFLFLSAVLFVSLAFYLREKLHWPILLAFAAMSTVMVGFKPFIWGITTMFLVSLFFWLRTRSDIWRLAFLVIIAGAIGFSVHFYIPIRSTQHPVIDENTPSRSFSTFINFLDRKQYGSESMTERMFHRRGKWINQFGDHARMGYWRFFKGQYSSPGIFLPIFLIGILGMVMAAHRNSSWGFIFITFFLIASVGLILYMNFADGTHYDKMTGDAYQEVRDRDYFFTPAFILFGMAIGLGFGAILELVRSSTEKMAAPTHKAITYAVMALTVLTPIIPVRANYHANNRSGNYNAYNYAYNLLNSCDKDAILFTSGDNDTFPLWCAQEVYNMRKDVRVINFSLLNTDWYIWQLKHMDSLSVINANLDIDSLAAAADSFYLANANETGGSTVLNDSISSKNFSDYLDHLASQDKLPQGVLKRVPTSLSDDQILWYDTTMSGQTVARPREFFVDRVRSTRDRIRRGLLVPSLYDNKTLKVSQVMLEDIIINNLERRFNYPIYFSSASGDVRNSPLNILDYCIREGITMRMTSVDTTKLKYDIPKSDSLFFRVYRYTSANDTTVSINENASGIAIAYPEKFLDYHAYITRTSGFEKADSLLNAAAEQMPYYWRLRLTQMDRYLRTGDTAQAIAAEDELFAYLHGFLGKNPDNIFFYQFLGMAYYAIADSTRFEMHSKRAEDYLLQANESQDRRGELMALAKRETELAERYSGNQSEKYLLEAWDINPDNEQTLRSLLTLYFGELQSMRQEDLDPDRIIAIADKMEKISYEFLDYHDDNSMALEGVNFAQNARRWATNAKTQSMNPIIPQQQQPIRVVPETTVPATPPGDS